MSISNINGAECASLLMCYIDSAGKDTTNLRNVGDYIPVDTA
jgi:hypothetical protein